MNNAEHLDRLNEAIKELQNILTDKKAEELSQMEIDLSLDKLKRMYDIVLRIKARPIVEVGSKPMGIEKMDDKPDSKTLDREVESVLKIDESIHEMESPSNDIDTDEILTSVPEPEKEEVKAGDVLDLFNKTQVSEEDILPAEMGDELIEKETVADKLQKSKLESIKSAIGINEKFFFLNELFSGDLQTYNDNIEKLDSLNTQEEAFAFLNEMAEEFNWNKESEALEQISQMLESKFS